MTDIGQTAAPATGGKAKATLSAIYLMICQNVTPAIVGYCCAHWPLLNEATWFEIVDFALGALGGFVVLATPQHFVQGVTDFILFSKGAFKLWGDALRSKPD